MEFVIDPPFVRPNDSEPRGERSNVRTSFTVGLLANVGAASSVNDTMTARSTVELGTLQYVVLNPTKQYGVWAVSSITRCAGSRDLLSDG